MKISEMTNDQATVAMIRIAGPISNICDDDDALKIIDEIRDTAKKNPDMHPVKQIAKFLPKIVMFGLSKHKNDFYEIIGALTETPIGKVGKMNFMQTVGIVKESYDDVLKSFFTQSAVAEKISVSESV
jgi:hypothetical protein